ncbi:chromate transporter [Fundicoccus sp. Sow4_D5]|uniref:chromate transporter n=1 Tax=unclassified Fundicoccus TaxID=2761543 RepID=UPI003F8FAA0B
MSSLHKNIVIVFLKLGLFAFGGPAAHIAMMEEELVTKRKWMKRQEFLDLLGFTNLIPGPNSTELAILIGYSQGGVLGLFLAGISFILPAMILVLIIGYLYVTYGEMPQIQAVFNFIQPVVVAIIVKALVKLGKTAISNIQTFMIFILSFVLITYGLSEITVLLIAGAMMFTFKQLTQYKANNLSLEPISLMTLFLTFLKIGSVLYGSGYVLLAFIQAEFVDRLGVLTQSQMMDAIAVGEVTPGPVFTTATFVGYILHDLSGGIVATIGIFLPSFLLILILAPVFNRLKHSEVFSNILLGVNVAALALMASVTFQLGAAILIQWHYLLVFIISLLGLMYFKLNSVYFIIGAIALGLVTVI